MNPGLPGANLRVDVAMPPRRPTLRGRRVPFFHGLTHDRFQSPPRAVRTGVPLRASRRPAQLASPHHALHPDATLAGPGFRFDDRDAIVAGMRVIERYEATQHHVHNQLVTLDGGEAEVKPTASPATSTCATA